MFRFALSWPADIAGLVLAVFFALTTVAQAQTATVTDGDTIHIGHTVYRLWGIDAPEAKQWCGDYQAGTRATAALGDLMKGRTVTCEDRGHDRYRRTIGLCRADGDDLSAAMVRRGMAWAFIRYSRDYVGLEDQARQERLGVHAHACELPWEWRARRPPR